MIPRGDLPRDPLGDQHLEVPHDRRDFQKERKDDQGQEERRDDFADDVAVDRSEHQGLQPHYPAFSDAERKAPAGRGVCRAGPLTILRGTFHRPLSDRSKTLGSDNECYVNYKD